MAAKKQIKQLTQEMSEYQTELQKKIEEAKEEQQREFRNERAELEACLSGGVTSENRTNQSIESAGRTKTQSPKQSFNYFD